MKTLEDRFVDLVLALTSLDLISMPEKWNSLSADCRVVVDSHTWLTRRFLNRCSDISLALA